MMLAVLAACGSPESNAPTTSSSENTPSQPQDQSPTENNSSTPDEEPSQPEEPKTDGLTVNMENRGTTVSLQSSLSSYQFMIGEKTYKWPVSISDLVSDGWKIPDYYDLTQEFKPQTTTRLYDGHLLSPNGTRVDLVSIYNDSDSPAVLADMKVLGFQSLDVDDWNNLKLVLPRGITMKSTAADIWAAYGDPTHSQQFLGGNIGSNTLTYSSWNSESEMIYKFTFNADGTISAFSIEYDLK